MFYNCEMDVNQGNSKRIKDPDYKAENGLKYSLLYLFLK